MSHHSSHLQIPRPRAASFKGWTSVVAVALAVLVAQACSAASGAEKSAGNPSLLYGEAVAVGGGTARTYIVMDADTPTEIGIALSESVLADLPSDHGGEGAVHMPDGHSMYEFTLPLPRRNETPFRQVVLNWNPGGHEPPGIYDQPHFDFHFYMIDTLARKGILPSDPLFQLKAERLPAPELIPAGYVLPAPMAVPQMGVHWVDPTSPELNGKTFTRTFIYGSWDGELIFAEPMITKAFLEARTDSSFALPAAARYPKPGYHPTTYRVRWDDAAREYRVSLTGLVRRD